MDATDAKDRQERPGTQLIYMVTMMGRLERQTAWRRI